VAFVWQAYSIDQYSARHIHRELVKCLAGLQPHPDALNRYRPDWGGLLAN
jgi:hypothetical protein